MKQVIYFLFGVFFIQPLYCMNKDRDSIKTPQSPRSLDSSHGLAAKITISLIPSDEKSQPLRQPIYKKPYLEKVKSTDDLSKHKEISLDDVFKLIEIMKSASENQPSKIVAFRQSLDNE